MTAGLQRRRVNYGGSRRPCSRRHWPSWTLQLVQTSTLTARRPRLLPYIEKVVEFCRRRMSWTSEWVHQAERDDHISVSELQTPSQPPFRPPPNLGRSMRTWTSNARCRSSQLTGHSSTALEQQAQRALCRQLAPACQKDDVEAYMSLVMSDTSLLTHSEDGVALLHAAAKHERT